MSDKTKKAAEVKDLMDELFESKPKNIKGLKEVYQVPKPTVRDKKEKAKVVHENNPSLGGTVIHGENAQIVNNHKVIDYKIDNTAIDQGRAVIGARKRGDRVNPVNMTPSEYRNYLYYQFDIKVPGKLGWNGIDRSNYKENWEPDESQNIKNKKDALKFLGIAELKKAPDGIEKRNKTSRRVGKKDIRKDKIDRRTLKQRRKEEKQDDLTYYLCSTFGLLLLIIWGFTVLYFNTGEM